MPWVAGGVVPATGKNRAKAAAQRGGEGDEVLECIRKDTEMGVGDKSCVTSVSKRGEQ